MMADAVVESSNRSGSYSSEFTESEGQIYYAISDFKADQTDQLDLKEGDEVKILEKVNDGWWWVELRDVAGYVPANHLSCDLSPDSEDQWQNEEYFSSYDTLNLHLEMLQDKSRTLSYRKAIEGAKHYIQGKVVLDFGCGSGILSLFCARLGEAEKVYAVDASSISKQATKIIEHNGLSDQIEVMHCKGEDMNLPEQVDLIISEWMGTLLLFELMLESVLVARDNYLKPDGVMWPSDATLFLVPCSADQLHREKIEFWRDVYGFDFSPLMPMAQQEIFGQPIYNHVMHKEECLSEPVSIMNLKLLTLQVEDLEENEMEFSFIITKSGMLHGFGSWFEVKFDDIPNPASDPVVLSTSPFKELTHWKQDLLMMDDPIPVHPDDVIKGRISIIRNQHWRRHLRVNISYTHYREEKELKKSDKEFKLWR